MDSHCSTYRHRRLAWCVAYGTCPLIGLLFCTITLPRYVVWLCVTSTFASLLPGAPRAFVAFRSCVTAGWSGCSSTPGGMLFLTKIMAGRRASFLLEGCGIMFCFLSQGRSKLSYSMPGNTRSDHGPVLGEGQCVERLFYQSTAGHCAQTGRNAMAVLSIELAPRERLCWLRSVILSCDIRALFIQ